MCKLNSSFFAFLTISVSIRMNIFFPPNCLKFTTVMHKHSIYSLKWWPNAKILRKKHTFFRPHFVGMFLVARAYANILTFENGAKVSKTHTHTHTHTITHTHTDAEYAIFVCCCWHKLSLMRIYPKHTADKRRNKTGTDRTKGKKGIQSCTNWIVCISKRNFFVSSFTPFGIDCYQRERDIRLSIRF